MTKHTHPLRTGLWISLISLILAGLAACGGGGGGGSSARLTNGELITSNESIDPANANRCAAPRPNTVDQFGLLDNEKAWVRALMDKTYLWYRDVPNVNAAAYTSASFGGNYPALDAYFKALKTPLRTGTGLNKLVDEFSFTVPSAQLSNQQAGVSSGYGMRLAIISSAVPRNISVLYVETGSPAAAAGISRGDRFTSVDGVSIDVGTQAGIDTINSGLFPAVASKTTQFGLVTANGTTRTLSVTSSQNVTVTPVALTQTFTVGTNTVGYLVLNSFSINSAEAQLVNAINQLKAANITELVLDLRYNGGGFLEMSNQLAWMIGGSSLAGKVYETTICNDKNPFSICNTSDLFQQNSVGFSLASGQALPQLGMKRVFVLTSASTCSASESVINGLAPFLPVVQIGKTTCGKPYGFYYLSNCGTSYAAMHFKGANAVGFGDYAEGFAPKCNVPDDLSKQRGDRTEGMLAAALGYVQSGACPASVVSQKIGSSSSSSIDLGGDFKVMRSPLEEQRWYRLQP